MATAKTTHLSPHAQAKLHEALDSPVRGPQVRAHIERLRKDFVERFGREPGPGDPLITDPRGTTPRPMDPKLYDGMMALAAFKADISPAIIFCALDSGCGLLPYNSMDTDMQLDWEESVERWDGMSRQQRRAWERETRKLAAWAESQEVWSP